MLNVINARQTTLDFHRQAVGRFTTQLKTNILHLLDASFATVPPLLHNVSFSLLVLLFQALPVFS